MKTVSKQMNVQSLGDRKEELTESAKNKLKQELNLRISKQLTPPPNSKKIRKSLKKQQLQLEVSFAEVSLPTTELYKDLDVSPILDEDKYMPGVLPLPTRIGAERNDNARD